jgi:hypothetical protein
MAVSYATIIETIDTAINTWAGRPVSIAVEGRTITYRSLRELMDARKYYSQLAAGQSRQGFRITALRSTSAR